MKKLCPRCGTEFLCLHDDPAICQCAGIELSAQARAYLRANYKDCLCRACLLQVSREM
ncbi:MAG: cysteine-rich CWC family protein [Paludibacteraceae bacterium]|nr:cysteine-rich CWC family protein [Paludibacteraceae bacterium]